MEIARTGIIINTERYEQCVAFYRDLFDLEILFAEGGAEDGLTCFAFGESYLMVETAGKAKPPGKTIEECPMKLRFNVPDIHRALERVHENGIDARIEAFSWGQVINFHDPDGNRVGIRDESGFIGQYRTRD